ncbi:hypothetical protein L227DRAFT_590192 [Lentinus tigrinus ALCF2SS1-6]|uniref:Uncharacterized protein n=1 Tax=Lentinus tigrinus ALCF2SS1-6 TaxID=1328759 RepID=A0A5C2SVY0_9APHY|nr:hypothetical protein L227DRAFT_590192 [Lentinus tigrinus ALCF2SS1-6]
MPQVYNRRHSDYSPRPSLVPRRRSSMAPSGPGPQPTDADDSIVLADLVRTGEASRLRRRGAMHRPPPPAVGAPGAGPSSYAPPARPIIIEPSRTPSPELNAESGADEYTYTSGPLMWRDWEGSGRIPGRGADGVQAVEILSESTQAGQAFVLHCGGEDTSVVEEVEPPRRFEPALFPGSHPSPSAGTSSRTYGKAVRKSNGCGALVHVRAYPQRPRGVWMAKEDAAETVVGLDPAYCDHPSMDKMLKSACGCIREGIGCSVCGNTLGTRYVPCQAASESIFSPSPTHSTSPSLVRPQRPAGPSYWNARPTAPHRRSSSSVSASRAAAPSYYTFFADRVTASPAHDRPRHAAGAPTSLEPRRGASRPGSPEIDYGYRWTASPQMVATPLPVAESAGASNPPPPLSPVFAPPPLPTVGRSISQLRPASSTMRSIPTFSPGFIPPPLVVNTPNREPVVELDADGVPISEMDEPNSPDKEVMSWPGR